MQDTGYISFKQHRRGMMAYLTMMQLISTAFFLSISTGFLMAPSKLVSISLAIMFYLTCLWFWLGLNSILEDFGCLFNAKANKDSNGEKDPDTRGRHLAAARRYLLADAFLYYLCNLAMFALFQVDVRLAVVGYVFIAIAFHFIFGYGVTFMFSGPGYNNAAVKPPKYTKRELNELPRV